MTSTAKFYTIPIQNGNRQPIIKTTINNVTKKYTTIGGDNLQSNRSEIVDFETKTIQAGFIEQHPLVWYIKTPEGIFLLNKCAYHATFTPPFPITHLIKYIPKEETS